MTTGERDNEGARGIAETAADDAARVGTLDVRRFQLTVVEGPARGLVWRSSAARCSIGAHHRNDVVLDDPTVSRFHCEVVAEAGGLRVLDLESRNGTVLDGVVVRDLSVAGMRRWACRLAGRDLSAADWRRYLRDQPAPAPVCPALQRPDLGE